MVSILGVWERIEEKLIEEVLKEIDAEIKRFISKFDIPSSQCMQHPYYNRPFIRLSAKKAIRVTVGNVTLSAEITITNQPLHQSPFAPESAEDADKFNDFEKLVAEILAKEFGGNVKVVHRGRMLQLCVDTPPDTIIVEEAMI